MAHSSIQPSHQLSALPSSYPTDNAMRPGTEQSTVGLGRRRPEQYQAIGEILYNTRTYRNAFVSVCGVVTTIQPAAPTRGTDLQFTFTLADQDGAILKVKFFRQGKMDLPWIQRTGDVVFLRNIKVTSFSGQVLLISNVQTEYHVFPKEWICEPWYRQQYMTDLFEQASCSSGTYTLEPHLQQWAITLRAQYREAYPNEFPKRRSDGPVMADAPLITTADMHEAGRFDFVKAANASIAAAASPQSPATALTVSEKATTKTIIPGTLNNSKPNSPATSRNKFSTIKDMQIQGSGSFYDLIGEVVKIFYSPRTDITEVYITDYTENTMLRDYQPEDVDSSSQGSSTFPLGRRTLKVDLFPPHSYWANQNVSVGYYILLKNVRVKWSTNQEAEGSMWKDFTYPDRLGVSLLSQSDAHFEMISNQKRIYREHTSSSRGTNFNQPKKLSKKQKKRERKERERLKDIMEREQQDCDDGDPHNPSELKPAAAPPRCNTNVVVSAGQSSKLSSLWEVVHNPNRIIDGKELPFINVKHLVRIAVVDYWPHNLKEFSFLSKERKWEWRFFLVVKDMEDKDGFLHNIEVAGSQAETLLEMKAQDLTGKFGEKGLKKLQEKMFILWGDLHEKKDKFLAAHPHIPPDAEFQATKYNIVADNVPFEAGVLEYGLKVMHSGVKQDYILMHRLFGTEIKA